MKKILATQAPRPRSTTVRNVAWLYAAILVVMAVSQLFSFERFIPLLDSYWLPGGHGTASLVAGLVVTAEVFALPFLLRMDLSPLMRWFSLFCGGLVAFLWAAVSLFAVSHHTVLSTSGLLGTKIHVATGIPSLAVSVVLIVLAAWSIQGLWPADNE